MKIYEIGTGYTPIPAQMGAATEIVVEELTRSFLKKGEDVEIIDIGAENRASTSLPIIEVKVPARFSGTDVSLGIMHKLKRVVYSVSLANTVKKLLKRENEKVVLHFHNQYNLYFVLKLVPRKLLEKATVAYTVHSYIWSAEWDKIKDTVKKKYFQEIYCVKNADTVFVLNDMASDHLIHRLGVGKEKIHRINNGVNTERYAPLDKALIEQMKENIGVGGKKVVFQVGSVCDRKNQLGALEMLADYMKENQDVVFMYAGGIIDSEYQARILSYAEEKGLAERVKYAGELAPGEVLNRYYNMADCCIFTPKREAFTLVVFEALSSGTPVVYGDNLSFPACSGCEKYHSEEQFVEKVDQMLCKGKNKKEEYGTVLELFTWDKVAGDYLYFFETEPSKNQE